MVLVATIKSAFNLMTKRRLPLIQIGGYYVYQVMPFDLCNAQATFQRVITQAFWDFVRDFMKIFLDEFCVNRWERNHLDCLHQCLMRCWAYSMSLNSKKCIFAASHGLILGYIVSSKGLMPNINKFSKFLQLKPPTIVIELQSFV